MIIYKMVDYVLSLSHYREVCDCNMACRMEGHNNCSRLETYNSCSCVANFHLKTFLERLHLVFPTSEQYIVIEMLLCGLNQRYFIII